MSSGAVDGLEADRDTLIEIGRSLDAQDWEATSGWSGWSVQGLVSHLAGGFWRIVDPGVLVDTTGLTLAQGQDAVVASRSSWTPDQVLDDYASVSRRAIDQLARLDGRDHDVSFGDLGTFRASMAPNSFGFDHFTHIRADLCGPRGPLAVAPPPSDELRLVPALDWIEAALPQQNADLIAALDGSLVIEVAGIGARTLVVGRGPQVGRVDTQAVGLIGWLTQRWRWDELDLTASGDEAALTVARQLGVA